MNRCFPRGCPKRSVISCSDISISCSKATILPLSVMRGEYRNVTRLLFSVSKHLTSRANRQIHLEYRIALTSRPHRRKAITAPTRYEPVWDIPVERQIELPPASIHATKRKKMIGRNAYGHRLTSTVPMGLLHCHAPTCFLGNLRYLQGSPTHASRTPKDHHHGLQANRHASLRQRLVPPDRPGARAVRQCGHEQVGQVRCRHGVRWLGGSELGARSRQVHDRRRRRSLRQGTGQAGEG